MQDSFDREINYMRISLTDRCNYRCKYCMPEAGVADIGHGNVLTFEQIERIVTAASELGISKYRLTGGEPLVRKGASELIEALSKISGVQELTMTTNGALLGQMAKDLKAAGLSRVNISLDSLKDDKFYDITRGGKLDDVFQGINAAQHYGLTPVKLNVVIMKGFNDDEIMDFVQMTISHEIDVRFIELMPIGEGARKDQYEYMSCDEIKSKLPSLRRIEGGGGVAELYQYPMAKGKIGFISPISNCFCENCNKLRLTADGKLKTCLHSDQEIDLRPALTKGDYEMLKGIIKDAVLRKEEKHQIDEGFSKSSRDMNKIGG